MCDHHCWVKWGVSELPVFSYTLAKWMNLAFAFVWSFLQTANSNVYFTNCAQFNTLKALSLSVTGVLCHSLPQEVVEEVPEISGGLTNWTDFSLDVWQHIQRKSGRKTKKNRNAESPRPQTLVVSRNNWLVLKETHFQSQGSHWSAYVKSGWMFSRGPSQGVEFQLQHSSMPGALSALQWLDLWAVQSLPANDLFSLNLGSCDDGRQDLLIYILDIKTLLKQWP